jgi:hypothetical protein
VLKSLCIELAVDCPQAAHGCLQQILADLSGMSMPAGNSSAPSTAAPPAERLAPSASAASPAMPASSVARPREIGGRAGPEPTRFGDWEKNGRCIDF